jgi:hypothetical protein
MIMNKLTPLNQAAVLIAQAQLPVTVRFVDFGPNVTRDGYCRGMQVLRHIDSDLVKQNIMDVWMNRDCSLTVGVPYTGLRALSFNNEPSVVLERVKRRLFTETSPAKQTKRG